MAVATQKQSETAYDWSAQPRQVMFLGRIEDEVLYGGAAGGGKTDALLAYSIARRFRYAGSRGLFLRRSYADLARAGAALDRSRELLTDIAHYDQQAHRWTFANKSTLDFGYLEADADKYRYQSAQYDDIVWDELTQFEEGQYLYLMSRCRATVAGIKPRVRAACNPGGIGHNWVRARFVDPGPAEATFDLPRSDGQTDTRRGCFIPAKLQDNRILMLRDPGYWDRLMALNEVERRALAYGDWDVFAGQVFREWRRDLHVCAPFAIPPEWPRWIAYDYGYAAPACALWMARAPSKTLYVYREYYTTGRTDTQQGLDIRAVCKGERIVAAVGDPACFSRQPNGSTIASNLGIGLRPGNNDRLAGWQRVHEYLATDADHPQPRLQVFETCANLIRTLPALIYDNLHVEDVDSDGEDHAADALRYGLLLGSIPRQDIRTGEFEMTEE